MLVIISYKALNALHTFHPYNFAVKTTEKQ